ncbi:MAG TPA: class I SAM-dependent methyltransferase [Phycisphaerae bacterium]|nr:class I SAM-dependent methyltransferase [Phycisphaerae bacterium]
MDKSRVSILGHYRKLWYFTFNRFKGETYREMREYFTGVLIGEIEEFAPMQGRRVLDVGGAKGEFCKALSEQRGCDAVNLDPDPGGYVWPQTVVGRADSIPFGDNTFDFVICRGVLEHIPTEAQLSSLEDMHRVTKPGGICHVTIPPWYNPHAGHRLKPFHLLPFPAAKRLRKLVFPGSQIRGNSYEEAGLFPVTFRRMRELIASVDFDLLATRDTHLRLHFLTRLPGVREVAVPAVSFILRKRRSQPR